MRLKPSLSPNVIGTASVFTLFAIALYLIHDLIWMYHDDFGYATLSYSTTIDGIEGQNFKQINLLAFLRNEYMNWTGRVLPFFIEANVFKLGLPFTRFIQVIAILAVTWMSTCLSTQDKTFPWVAIAIAFYFCSVPVFVATGGVFWFSASISYLWGLPFLLYGAFRLQSDEAFSWQAIVTLALAALFQEQVALAALTIAGLFALHKLLEDKTAKTFFTLGAITSPILMASIFVLLSPGNFNRRNFSQYPNDPELSIVDINLEKVSDALLSPIGNPLWQNDSSVWLCALGLSFAVLLIITLSKKDRFTPILLAGLALWSTMSLALEWPEQNILISFITAYGVCLFIVQKRRNESYIVTYVYVAAVVTLILMLVSPAVAGRQYIPFFFLMAVPVGYSANLILTSDYRWIGGGVILALAPVAIEQSVDIYDKYAENDIYMQANDTALRRASAGIRRGDFVEAVGLTKLPDKRYAETMPYQRPKAEQWLRRYYILPDYVRLEWKEPPKKAKPLQANK